jgi:hypothetical protein
MAHAQKPDFVFRRNGRFHLNRLGRQFSRILAADVCASGVIVGSNVGYTMFRSSVKNTGYPLHSPVSPSLPLPYVTVCHHISTGLYVHPRIRYSRHTYHAMNKILHASERTHTHHPIDHAHQGAARNNPPVYTDDLQYYY